jgi:hypothetical protein
MRRREFITLAGAAAWPIAARAQQTAAPVIGFLGTGPPEVFFGSLRGFHRGLSEAGYVEGENVAIVYRFAENQTDRLPELAADLVRSRPARCCFRYDQSVPQRTPHSINAVSGIPSSSRYLCVA